MCIVSLFRRFQTSSYYLNKGWSGLVLDYLCLRPATVSLRLLLHQPEFLQLTLQLLVLRLELIKNKEYNQGSQDIFNFNFLTKIYINERPPGAF